MSSHCISYIFFLIDSHFKLLAETYVCFFVGSPYYYSATSRGAGPAATATASAYDRHWPLQRREKEEEL